MENTEYYEDKIGELELKIETMENNNSLVYGIFMAFISYQQWHSWIISCVAFLIAAVWYWKFIADRPFTKFLRYRKSNFNK